MKGLYLHFFGFNGFSGISKKIGYQVAALERCGIEMTVCSIEIDEEGTQKRVCDSRVIDNFGRGFRAKFGKWISFSNLIRYIIANKIGFVYVRSFYNTNPFMLRMFKVLKKHKVIIVLEYPTYPYDQETKSEHIRYQPIYFLNRIFRRFLKGKIDRVVTFTDLSTIDGVKCINISNAIDFSAVKLSQRPYYDGSTFSMIAVAEIHFWHGYDRVLYGLHDYYAAGNNNTEVHFHIVGEGSVPDRDMLVQLTKRLNLGRYVHFHNNQYGKSLDMLFDKSHFAIASLARHRTGIESIKTLKNREYAARGIPFAYSENDSDFDFMPYVCKVPPDESPVDILSLIEFSARLEFSAIEIRSTVEDNLNWDVQMKKVISSVGID